MCRTAIRCSEGEELWQLTFNEAHDIQSYANDLVSRIYEFFDKMPKSAFTEDDITRSRYDFSAAALALKQRLMESASSLRTTHPVAEPSSSDPDYLLAVSLASNDDQYAVERQVRELCRDEIIAQALATEAYGELTG